MTAFTFFGAQLFVLYTGVGHLGLVLACGASAALGFLLRQRLWAGLASPPPRLARWVGLGLAGAVGLALVLGLRVQGTAYDPSAPAMGWEWFAAACASAGVVLAAYAAASGAAGAAVAGSAAQGSGKRLEAGVAAPDEVEAAVAAYQTLKTAVERLRQAEKEAAARGAQVSDGVASQEYVKAASAIRNRLQLAEELQGTAGAAVLRLACKAPVKRVLARRPDEILSRLNDKAQTSPLGPRVEEALVAVRGFMSEIEGARRELAGEMKGAPGSVAARVGLDAGERAKPFDAALSQIETTYGQVSHRLEALRLRVGAEADVGAVAGAAMELSVKGPPGPSKDLVEVALEMAQAEQSAATALGSLGSEPTRRLTDAVVRVSAELARDGTDDEALAEVIRSVRSEIG